MRKAISLVSCFILVLFIGTLRPAIAGDDAVAAVEAPAEAPKAEKAAEAKPEAEGDAKAVEVEVEVEADGDETAVNAADDDEQM